MILLIANICYDSELNVFTKIILYLPKIILVLPKHYLDPPSEAMKLQVKRLMLLGLLVAGLGACAGRSRCSCSLPARLLLGWVAYGLVACMVPQRGIRKRGLASEFFAAVIATIRAGNGFR